MAVFRWILFLRILDEHEDHEAEEAKALGIAFTPTLNEPFRWRDWAAPESAPREGEGEFHGRSEVGNLAYFFPTASPLRP